MEQQDLKALMRIEKSSGMEELYSARDFQNLCHNDHQDVLVYVLDGKVIGYLAYEVGPHNDILLSIAIHPDYRQQGHGKALLGIMTRRKVIAVCREGALDAQLFLKACGFEWISSEEDIYHEPPEVAYVFKREVDHQQDVC